MHEVWRNSIYVLFLCYPSTSETIVDAFLCYRLPDGRRYLLEDFNILCNGAYTALMYPAATINLIIYGLGVPVAFFIRLRKYKDVLTAPAAQTQLGFLYRG